MKLSTMIRFALAQSDPGDVKLSYAAIEAQVTYDALDLPRDRRVQWAMWRAGR